MQIPLACFLVGLVTALLAAQNGAGQNSGRKVRIAPSDQAARVGTAVPFADSLELTLAQAKQTGKPVFWYIAAVAGSPMDRKPELDRYLRGGPFSWPSTIDLLQAHFHCVDEVPSGAVQQRFGLRRNEFIEPGYLVLDGDGKVRLRVDQVTTFHPQWFEAPLRRLCGVPADGFPGAPGLRPAWQAYRDGAPATAIALAEGVLAAEPAAALAAQAHWLVGATLCRTGQRAAANERWRLLASALPEQPLAWKAALEVEGHGPFVHGFEDYLALPELVLAHDPEDGSRVARSVDAGAGAAARPYDETQLWQRSVQFLLAMPDDDGVYRDSIYDFGGTDSLPNVYAAVTCLAGMALLAAEARAEAGLLPLAAATKERMAAQLVRIKANVESEGWLALSDRDEILWARAYAVRFLAAWHARRAADRQELLPALQNAVGALLALQPETGVWFHEYGNPFAIATALQSLHEAKAAGVTVAQDNLDRGLRALAQNRTEQGAFTYSHTARGKPRASIEAAAGRMPLCELALLLFGASDQERLAAALDAGARHHGLLAAVRKYDDHADRHGYGGFFFWFDMLGRAEAIAQLAEDAARRERFAALHTLVLDLPEFDGCFVDSHELGRVYGTAMALLCLDRCAR